MSCIKWDVLNGNDAIKKKTGLKWRDTFFICLYH